MTSGNQDNEHSGQGQNKAHLDELLDQGLADTFPASDPVSVSPPETAAASSSEAQGPGAPRLDYWKSSPQGMVAFRRLEDYLAGCGLEISLLNLLRIRASQINGCAFCLDMHTKDARAAGETEQRIFTLSAWREAPFFTARERQALAWTEAVTAISQTSVTDGLYDNLRRVFSDKECADLTLAVIAINGWNRLAITFRTPAGSYQPRSGSARVPVS